MKLIPPGDKLLVKVDAIPEKVGHIVIPENARDRTAQDRGDTGTIVTVGTGVNIPDELLPDVRVFFKRHAGIEVTILGKNHRILHADDILAILE